MRLVAISLSLTCSGLAGAPALAQCVPLQLAFSPSNVHELEYVSAVATGPAGTVGVLGFDIDPGPTFVPGVGLVQLGFGPYFGVFPIVVPASGQYELTFRMPCKPISDVYAQALTLAGPAGVCLSNPATLHVDHLGGCGGAAVGAANAYGVLQLGGHSVTITLGGVTGDVGVGPNGSFSISGSSFVSGTLSLSAGDGYAHSGSSSVGTLSLNADLTQPIQDALAAAANSAAMPCTQSFATWDASLTVTGVAGTNVICVSNVTLQANDFITLSGPPGTNFVVNVTGAFAMSGGSAIRVGGAVSTTNVLINVVGAGAVININGGSWIEGTLLAAQRGVSLSLGATRGQVIAGGSIVIQSGATVTCPCIE